MIENNFSDQSNRLVAFLCAMGVVVVSWVAVLSGRPIGWLGLPIAAIVYVLLRRKTVRRLKVLDQPFPKELESRLIEYVAFFRALDEKGRERFRSMVKVFLDEVPITGIRTEVDDTTRALVAASAVIPVFGFDDWEYSGLGEVLIYPNAFGSDFSIKGEGDEDQVERRTLGMVGVGNLSGVMILSKADLISGFANPQDKRNVGIHEFAHLVDLGDGSIDGLPPGVNLETAGPWLQWIGEELKNRPDGRHHIDDYAYTNEAEYFAVLTEYFFEAPDVLKKKAPDVYSMMQSMYRQNTRSFLSTVATRPKRIGRNAPCPCGSGKKYKRCCRRNR